MTPFDSSGVARLLKVLRDKDVYSACVVYKTLNASIDGNHFEYG